MMYPDFIQKNNSENTQGRNMLQIDNIDVT